MAPTTFVAGNLQWLGIAKETTYGTAPAAPTAWIPVDSPKWDPKITPLLDAALRGTMGAQFGQVQGMRYDEVSYKTYLFPDTCFPHFLAALGVADTGSATLATPAAPTTTTATTGGTLAAATYYYKVTATTATGESAASAEASQATTGTTSTVTVNWTTVTNATGYKVYRSTATGAEVLLTTLGNVLTYTDTGSATPGTKTAPTAAAYTHKTSLLNTAQTGQPASYTVWLFEGDKTVQITGCVIADLKVAVKANELPTLDVQWQGMPGTFVTAPANTPSSVAPMPPFTATTTIGGTALSKYSGFSIDLKRGTKPIPALNGTQSPLAIFCGELTVTGTLDAIYQNTTDNDLTNLINNTQPTVSLAIAPQGVPGNTLTFQMSKVAYDTSTPAGSNSGWMTLSSNFKALMNATDALDSVMSPIQVQLVNQTATAY